MNVSIKTVLDRERKKEVEIPVKMKRRKYQRQLKYKRFLNTYTVEMPIAVKSKNDSMGRSKFHIIHVQKHGFHS